MATKPYDSTQARKLIRTAKTMERLPGSEFILEIGAMLESADEELAGSSTKIRRAEQEAERARQEADTAANEARQARLGAGRPLELALAALREIAGGGKGAKKRAADALAVISGDTPAPVVASTQSAPPEQPTPKPPPIGPQGPRPGGMFFKLSDQPIIGDRI